MSRNFALRKRLRRKSETMLGGGRKGGNGIAPEVLLGATHCPIQRYPSSIGSALQTSLQHRKCSARLCPVWLRIHDRTPQFPLALSYLCNAATFSPRTPRPMYIRRHAQRSAQPLILHENPVPARALQKPQICKFTRSILQLEFAQATKRMGLEVGLCDWAFKLGFEIGLHQPVLSMACAQQTRLLLIYGSFWGYPFHDMPL